jgi:hypothetical protein
MIRSAACSCLLAAVAFGMLGCAQTPSGVSGKSGGLVHTPAPPPPEIREDKGAPPPVVAGGYTGASPVNEANAGETAARDFAVAAIYRKFPQRGLVESSTVKTQVVAGLNYWFHIVMTGGKAYDVVVYRDLQDHMSVSSLDQADR